ncbi:MAG: HupE/UreJ family protein [Pseudomonadota bacterium]
MKSRKSLFALTGAMLLVPSVAFAHPEHGADMSLLQGLLHPLTGLDHVLAMTAVGLWAAQQGGRAFWVWPLTFISVMLVGGLVGMEGFALPAIEPVIAASVFVLGLLVAGSMAMSVRAGAALIGLFALFHGNAHGLEAPVSGAGAIYAFGFVLATASLHVAGLAFGLIMANTRAKGLSRVGGLVTAGIGGIFFFA